MSCEDCEWQELMRKQEAKLDQLIVMNLPRHNASLTISHNQHKDYYKTVAEKLAGLKHIGIDWISEEDKRVAIETDELWEMQWYPNTPIGFHLCMASSLEILLELALKIERDNE